MLDEQKVEAWMNEMLAEIPRMPEEPWTESGTSPEQPAIRAGQPKPAVADIDEKLDLLRCWIKYLLFDLEATRRESAAFRKMLEEHPDAD